MRENTANKDDHFNTDQIGTGLKKKAMRGAGATLFSSAGSFVIHFFSTVILARLLTPDDFGLVTMVTAFSLLLQNFGGNGFTEAVIQKEDINHGIMSTLFWLNAGISGGLTVLFILAAPLLSWFYKEPHLTPIAIGISFSIIASGLATVHMAILRRNMRFYVVSGILMFSTLASIVTAIVLAWFGWGYWALVANTVVHPLANAIGGWCFCSWRPGRPGRVRGVFPILKFALHVYGNFTLNYSSRNIDKLLVGWQLGAQSLGFYKKAFDLFALPANQLTAPLANVALAALSRLTREPDKYRRYYLDAVSTIAFIGMPLSAALTVAGNDVIRLVLGPQWTKAGEIFCYFGASIGIMLIYTTQSWLHLSLGHPERWLRWSLFECALTSLFFIAGVPFGAKGVAIGYTLSYYLLFGPCLSYAAKPIGLKVHSIVAVVWRYFVAAAASGIISYFLFYKTDFLLSGHNAFLRVVSVSASCFVFYLALTALFYRSFKPMKQFLATALQMLPVGRS